MSRKEPQKRLSARELVAKLNQQAAALRDQAIVAPVLSGGKIRTRLSGIIYEFKLSRPFAGWGKFRPVSDSTVEPLEEAMPYERAKYLELFPALRVILIDPLQSKDFPAVNQVWLALPYNFSDAKQRFGFNEGELLPVFLCDPLGGAQAFERVIARVDGKTLWFDAPDTLADPTHAEWLRNATTQTEPPETMLAGLAGTERMALLFWQIRHLAPLENNAQSAFRNFEEQREWLRQQSTTYRLEQALRRALAKADATLHSFSQTTNPDGTPGALVVEWSAQGQNFRYRSSIDPNLTVVSSGICLSGRDQDFDLTSLVNVMARSDED
jgi:hypothetical protein